MTKLFAIALTGLISFSNAFANVSDEDAFACERCSRASMSCTLGEEQIKLGARHIVTCESNPSTPENVVVVYCYEQGGIAKLSPRHTEIEPSGC